MITAARLRRGIAHRFEERVRRPWRCLRNAGRDLRPIFIAGAMGSGTSLVAGGLWQNFECGAMAFESARWMARRSFLHVAPVNTFDSIADYRAAIEPAGFWSVDAGRRDLLALYRSVATEGGDVAIDKGPNTNLVRAGFLDACFPDACWVLVFRDPVVNIEGFRRKWLTFGRDSLAHNIRFYADIHERFLARLPYLEGRLVAVEYEVFVADFETALANVGRRLALAGAHSVRRLEQRGNVEGQGLRNVDANGRINVVRDASRRSYARLSAADAARIQDDLGPLHEKLRRLACCSAE